MTELILPIDGKDIKSLLKIMQNILDNPNNTHFHNINIKRISKALKEHEICIYILKKAGFKISQHNDRLLYDNTQLHFLLSVHQQLLSFHSELSCETNTSKSKYLIQPRNPILTYSKSKSYSCSLNECLSLEIVAQALRLYKTYTSKTYQDDQKTNENIYDCIFSKIGNDYTVVDLLNDHNHLLLHHSDEFEDAYSLLCCIVNDNNVCEFRKCLPLRRNQRDRLTNATDIYNNLDDIIEEQVLDTIHSYYLHTFDIGHKLMSNEKLSILKNTEINANTDHDIVALRMRKLLNSKRNALCNVDGLERLNNLSTKFSANGSELDRYKHGQRFYYWNWYKNQSISNDPAHSLPLMCDVADMALTHCFSSHPLSYWYVENKYVSFKEELLCNKLCCIDETIWIQLIQKATLHIDTEHVKQMQCPRRESAKFYEMQYGDSMTEKHLIAMMLYCNYDKMQRKLSETYTKSDEKESDTSLKERHSNYYFWGRSLRECVECFGTDFSPEVDSADITLFRGINQQFMFESTLANIKGPFSTTTEYAVALNFCANKGMVLEMILQPQSWIFKWLEGMEAATRLSCIDCRFISDFSSENEIFCIGGLNPFRLSTIIEPSGVNYVQYINALNHLTVGMSTRFNFGQIAFD
eukprot:429590_1